jgi:RNA polymerase sigma-70 factor (ECF subfamily)
MKGASVAELEDVYRSRRRQFVRIARAITGDRERALDAVHDAFVRAVRDRESFQRRGSLDAWVARIVFTSAYDAVRADARAPSPAGAIDDGRPVEEQEADEAVRALVRSLPERQRHAVFLRHYADFDHTQIAEALGIARGTVAATLHAAHHELARRIEEVPT